MGCNWFMSLKNLLFLGLIATSCSLDENLCQLEKQEQEMLDKANSVYGQNLVAKRIPCEGIYIRIELGTGVSTVRIIKQ